MSFVLFRFFHSDVSESLFVLKYRVPWNEKTSSGWAATMAFSFAASFTYFLIDVVIVGFFISICLYFRAMRKHFKMANLKIYSRIDEFRFRRASDRTKQLLCGGIRFHIRIKRYLHETTFYRAILISFVFSAYSAEIFSSYLLNLVIIGDLYSFQPVLACFSNLFLFLFR